MASQIANAQRKNLGRMSVVYVLWTSATAGTVTIALGKVAGQPVCLVTDPGSAAPTADYDVAVTDEWGQDILNGGGVDRHTTNREIVFHGPGPKGVGDVEEAFIPVAGELTLVITAAGAAKTGEFWLYVQD